MTSSAEKQSEELKRVPNTGGIMIRHASKMNELAGYPDPNNE